MSQRLRFGDGQLCLRYRFRSFPVNKRYNNNFSRQLDLIVQNLSKDDLFFQ
jgi:hypothetical protein